MSLTATEEAFKATAWGSGGKLYRVACPAPSCDADQNHPNKHLSHLSHVQHLLHPGTLNEPNNTPNYLRNDLYHYFHVVQ